MAAPEEWTSTKAVIHLHRIGSENDGILVISALLLFLVPCPCSVPLPIGILICSNVLEEHPEADSGEAHKIPQPVPQAGCKCRSQGPSGTFFSFFWPTVGFRPRGVEYQFSRSEGGGSFCTFRLRWGDCWESRSPCWLLPPPEHPFRQVDTLSPCPGIKSPLISVIRVLVFSICWGSELCQLFGSSHLTVVMTHVRPVFLCTVEVAYLLYATDLWYADKWVYRGVRHNLSQVWIQSQTIAALTLNPHSFFLQDVLLLLWVPS